jgi:hypothetical protein
MHRDPTPTETEKGSVLADQNDDGLLFSSYDRQGIQDFSYLSLECKMCDGSLYESELGILLLYMQLMKMLLIYLALVRLI